MKLTEAKQKQSDQDIKKQIDAAQLDSVVYGSGFLLVKEGDIKHIPIQEVKDSPRWIIPDWSMKT